MALSDDVLLVWTMNGAPLLPQHGFPLRAAAWYFNVLFILLLPAVCIAPSTMTLSLALFLFGASGGSDRKSVV